MATLPIVNKEDKKYGILITLISLTLMIIVMFVITFQMADPPPHEIPVIAKTEIDEMLLENLKVEGDVSTGGGTPSDDKVVKEPQEQTEKIITAKSNPDHQVNTGEANKNTATSSTNEATTTEQSNDPFADGGSNNATGGGTFGKDGMSDGPKETAGGGGGGGRIRLNDPNVNSIECDNIEYIHLKLAINSNGKVISAINLSSKTTTTDQRIINLAKSAVIQQVNYNKKPGTELEYVYITVKLEPK